VGAFRADAARAGANGEIAHLVDELSRSSPEFAALWRDNEVVASGEGLKRLRHPELGLLELEFSVFAVDGRPDLGMIVYNPATEATAVTIRACLAANAGAPRPGDADAGGDLAPQAPRAAPEPCTEVGT
jgi:hypothetical protein